MDSPASKPSSRAKARKNTTNSKLRFLRDLNPQSKIERTLAERIIAATWRMQRFQRMEAAYFDDRVNSYLEDNPEASPDSALAYLFIDPAEIAKTKLFLRYQTTVQREFDKAFAEFRKARAEREKQLLDEAVLQAARERPQVPQKTMAAAVGGFASQPAPANHSQNEKYFTMPSTSATLTACSSASLL